MLVGYDCTQVCWLGMTVPKSCLPLCKVVLMYCLVVVGYDNSFTGIVSELLFPPSNRIVCSVFPCLGIAYTQVSPLFEVKKLQNV